MAQVKKGAIVTGASRGIGKAVALRLAKDGFAVVVNYAGNSAKAQEVVAEIEAAGGFAVAIQADVSDEKDVKRLFVDSLQALGRLDVVVNCAGVMPLFPIAGADVAAFDRVIATNLRGAFLMLSQAATHVQSGGRIIAFSTSAIPKAFANYGAYLAAKAGVETLVHVLANELRGRNVTVNSVAPGPTGTDLFLNGKTEAQIDQLAKLAPLERIGQPEEIASVVAFLAGPDGSWVNSQVVRTNGGFSF
ncbi:SDR family oxidoreductase [Pendulispora brunnea]|uniref:SDR family oxidoreductase n=1 Tax=Pendulispora brunnea TaxID=2905690 RepID=A0ABZ2K9Z9_9BACT